MPTGFLYKGKCMLAEAQKKLRGILMEKKMAMNLKKRILAEQVRIMKERMEQNKQQQPSKEEKTAAADSKE